jgi:nucleoside diphosphate kinase
MDDAGIAWDRTVFMLLAPDAIARHLAGDVVDRVVRLGFRPLAWRVLWHRPAQLDAFHERNITQVWKAYLYRLVDQLFAFGPTVALLVQDEGDQPGRDSHQRLRDAKGASEPAQTVPGTIRGDLRSINVMLSLVHSADSPADSRHESAVFADTDGFDEGEPDELFAVLGLLSGARPAERRGYPEVLAGLRSRLLAAAWSDLPKPARRAATASADGLAAPGTGPRLADLLPDGHPLAAGLRADFTPTSPGPDPARLHAVMAAHGTGLDTWESLVLATSRRFPPRTEQRTG